MENLIGAYSFAFLFGFSYRYLIKTLAPKKLKRNANPNIGKPDKLLRFSIAITLLALGLYLNSFLFLFFSGFALFETIFSWCGFYALIGRNTCPIN